MTRAGKAGGEGRRPQGKAERPAARETPRTPATPDADAALRRQQAGTPLARHAAVLDVHLARTPAPARAAASRATLDAADRGTVVDALHVALGGAYCHLLQKRAGYAVDPVQALQLLRRRAATLSDAEFHLAVTGLVTSLRDAHTTYAGPRALAGRVAALPFLVEAYGPVDDPSFVVTKVSPGAALDDAHFRAGVTLETWNGIPFERAVALHADRETGGRPDARLARALESLTLRSLQLGPPPDELWVDVGYREGRGPSRELRIPWRVLSPGRAAGGVADGSHAARRLAMDVAAEHVRRAKKLLFSGPQWLREDRRAPVAREAGWLPTAMPDALSARVVRVHGVHGVGELGLLRLWTFDVDDHEAFVAEVARLLEQLPDTGLVVDVRGNPGGLVWAAERLLQLFTPHPISPARFALLATPLTRAMAASPFNRMELGPWAASLESAVATGEAYSQALPLTDPAWCDDVGQRYGGPVLCVADANTYSSGDLFCAGFVDHDVGPFVCVGEATGAGGANVWTSADLADALEGTDYALPRLPSGVSFTLAIRRALRGGASAGVPIEDLGIAGQPYAMTRADVLDGNADLLRHCARLLAAEPRTRLRATLDAGALSVETTGLDELELYVDGRPQAAAQAIADGTHALARPAASGTLEIVGRRAGEVVQRRRLDLGAP